MVIASRRRGEVWKSGAPRCPSPPIGYFRLAIPAGLAIISRGRRWLIRTVWGRGAENWRYANSQTALMFPIVSAGTPRSAPADHIRCAAARRRSLDEGADSRTAGSGQRDNGLRTRAGAWALGHRHQSRGVSSGQ
jgi:hypothetical protein